MKRIFDVLVAMIGFFILSPVLIILVILIKTTSHGPSFYVQNRIGLNGKIFRLYKFRTMVVNADKIGTSVTTKNDPRITPLGKVLRQLKLDELPQLINVLKGDMSLVGPRPDVPGFANMLQGEDRIILSLRPGITGPATLAYRNEEELLANQSDPDEFNALVIYPEKVRLNREYAQHYNFWKDIDYILKTILGR